MPKDDNAHVEQKAIAYARWLGERDGLTIDSTWEATAEWGDHEHVRSVNFTKGKNKITMWIPNWNWAPNKKDAA